MMKKFLFSLLVFIPSVVFAAGGHNPHLQHVDVDLNDKTSMIRGAKLFMNYCLGCHELGYQRYERTFNDLGIPLELGKEHLIMSDQKVGELITNSIDKEQAAEWFGATPPDLTLEARLRGPDWIYTYLKTFYHDPNPSRTFRVNNLMFPDVGMPHVLQELQGHTMLVEKDGKKMVVSDGSGEMSDDEYDQAVKDLVHFLVYVGEPSKMEGHALGWKILLFLLVLLILVYLTKKEYWKDVH